MNKKTNYLNILIVNAKRFLGQHASRLANKLKTSDLFSFMPLFFTPPQLGGVKNLGTKQNILNLLSIIGVIFIFIAAYFQYSPSDFTLIKCILYVITIYSSFVIVPAGIMFIMDNFNWSENFMPLFFTPPQLGGVKNLGTIILGQKFIYYSIISIITIYIYAIIFYATPAGGGRKKFRLIYLDFSLMDTNDCLHPSSGAGVTDDDASGRGDKSDNYDQAAKLCVGEEDKTKSNTRPAGSTPNPDIKNAEIKLVNQIADGIKTAIIDIGPTLGATVAGATVGSATINSTVGYPIAQRAAILAGSVAVATALSFLGLTAVKFIIGKIDLTELVKESKHANPDVDNIPSPKDPNFTLNSPLEQGDIPIPLIEVLDGIFSLNILELMVILILLYLFFYQYLNKHSSKYILYLKSKYLPVKFNKTHKYLDKLVQTNTHFNNILIVIFLLILLGIKLMVIYFTGELKTNIDQFISVYNQIKKL